MAKRPNIPLNIAREVRQRCGFGCVICGLPIYEYEHMEEWAIVKRHIAAEITLLCRQHHGEKTSGLLTKELVKEANANPFNKRKGVSKPYDFKFYGNSAIVKIGSLRFGNPAKSWGINGVVPIMIDNIPIVSVILDHDRYLLNIVLFDDNNELVLHIYNNRMVYSVDIWDITMIGRTLTIRQASHKIFIEIEFKPPNEVHIKRGLLLLNGVEVHINKDGFKINNSNNSFKGGLSVISQIGIGINCSVNGAMAFGLEIKNRNYVPFIHYDIPSHLYNP